MSSPDILPDIYGKVTALLTWVTGGVCQFLSLETHFRERPTNGDCLQARSWRRSFAAAYLFWNKAMDRYRGWATRSFRLMDDSRNQQWTHLERTSSLKPRAKPGLLFAFPTIPDRDPDNSRGWQDFPMTRRICY